ncbi:MAG: nitronate monooxygenase [Legionellaceae bacterium]|nr:nitronate monooxygenase [Legionellaceae bacterium]
MKKLLTRLNLRLPIIQAPMAGGIVTPEMIAAVSQAGGLGSLPLGYLNLTETKRIIQKTASLGQHAFAINVFIPSPTMTVDTCQSKKMLDHVNIYRARLALPPQNTIPPVIEDHAEEQIDLAVAEGVKIVSFTFGVLSQKKIAALHQQNVFVMGTATNIEEGLLLEKLGCDAVIAQGYEAGGHRGGGYLENTPGSYIGMMALVPQMVDALSIPVIAAGGIMNGQSVAASLALGASAVQMGTFFLSSHESNASNAHKQALKNNQDNSTCITAAFTGKPARGFKNKFVTDTEQKFKNNELLPYPHQHQVTKGFRAEANKACQTDYTSFWAGQGHRLSRSMPVSELMHTLEKEIESASLPMPYSFNNSR